MLHRLLTTSRSLIEFSGDGPLGQARRREEILLAQLHAVYNMSELFQIARKATSADEARRAIREGWRMTELQAQVITEMQVQRFTQMEYLKMRGELTDIRDFIAAQ